MFEKVYTVCAREKEIRELSSENLKGLICELFLNRDNYYACLRVTRLESTDENLDYDIVYADRIDGHVWSYFETGKLIRLIISFLRK
jgi:hypothetical protein